MLAAMTRLGPVVGAAWIVLGSLAWAQDRAPREPLQAGTIQVFNPVEGRATVLSSKPEGTIVKQGDLVCELNPAPLKERLAVEKLLLQSAEADLTGATLVREVAEMAVTEYASGKFKQELQTSLGEISLADVARRRAEEQLEWSNQMVHKGYVSLAQNIADKVSLQGAIFAFEQATTAKDVLLRFTKNKKMKELTAEVERTRAVELEKQAIRDRHKAARANLERQVERCRVTAPEGGTVRYGRPFGAGAVAQDGDLLFQIVPENTPASR